MKWWLVVFAFLTMYNIGAANLAYEVYRDAIREGESTKIAKKAAFVTFFIGIPCYTWLSAKAWIEDQKPTVIET